MSSEAPPSALVASLRALMEKATPGPWKHGRDYAYVDHPRDGEIKTIETAASAAGRYDRGPCHDLALAVAAVNALPALLSSPEAGAGEPVAWGILDRERRVIQSAPTEAQAREAAEMYDEDFSVGAPHTVAPLYLDGGCGECGGSGRVDSGGQNPDGSWIDVPCPSCSRLGVESARRVLAESTLAEIRLEVEKAKEDAKARAAMQKCPTCDSTTRVEGPCAVHAAGTCKGCPDPFHHMRPPTPRLPALERDEAVRPEFTNIDTALDWWEIQGDPAILALTRALRDCVQTLRTSDGLRERDAVRILSRLNMKHLEGKDYAEEAKAIKGKPAEQRCINCGGYGGFSRCKYCPPAAPARVGDEGKGGK